LLKESQQRKLLLKESQQRKLDVKFFLSTNAFSNN